MHPLTIQDLLAYRKCPRAFWLRREKASADAAERTPLCEEAAHALFSDECKQMMLHKTVRKNHCIALADLLIQHADGWEFVIDTNSLHLRETHVWEAAFASFVFTAAGYPVRHVTALLICPDYVRGAEMDWRALYIRQDITERTLSHIGGVKTHVTAMKDALSAGSPISHDLFESCLKPRECAYWSECSAQIASPNVFSIVGMSNRRKFQLYRKGVVSFEDCLKYTKLPRPQKMQVIHEIEKKPPLVNKQALEKFLKNIWYPVCFLDFESYQPPVPPFIGMKPFAQSAFLYSVHMLHDPDAQPRHAELFVPVGQDPRRMIAEGLCRDIPANACVAVYSSGLEKNVVKTLAQSYPDLRAHLTKILANMRDLLSPFRERLYYDRRMQGSCSLKHVLPAIDGALSYDDLSDVQNGEDAMHIYGLMHAMGPKERAHMEKRLREYCAMDTLAMVRILKTLEKAVED